VRPCLRSLIVALATSALLAISAAPAAAAERASLPDIEDEVMCPICGTILEASNSPQAEREREFIRAQIAQGKNKEQIQDALVVEYGPDVLAVPDSTGFDLVAWIVPIVGLLIAAGLLGFALWKIRGKPESPAGPNVSADDADNARIDRDIANSDL
jgi:cytochrome c-type biogenesis protein CcmH